MQNLKLDPHTKKALKEAIRSGMERLNGVTQDTPGVAIFHYEAKTMGGSSGSGVRVAKDLNELAAFFASQWMLKDARSLTIIIRKLTDEAKIKLREYLLQYAAQSFTLTKFNIHDGVLDEKTKQTINGFLERNRQFGFRKLKITFLAPFIGLMASCFAAPTLSSMFLSFSIYSAAAAAAYWLFTNRLKPSSVKNADYSYLLIYLSIAALVLLQIGGPIAFAITLLTGPGGLILNHFRDKIIKSALTKYSAPDVAFNEDEMSSFKHGLAAQKAFTPAYYAGLSSLKCPSAAYAGYYTPEIVLEDNIKQKLKV